MPVLLLVRHGRTTANAAATLAGRSPGVLLDDTGQEQVAALAERARDLRPSLLVSSPLERCRQTAKAFGADPLVDHRLQECDYGDWTGRPLAELRRLKLWAVVQEHPSAATFPGGESLRAMQARAVEAVRDHDAQVAREHGPNAVWVALSHGDVIKSVIADALGMHLDLFQRLVVDPGSVTAISYTERRPFLLRLNDTSAELRSFNRSRRGRRGQPRSDATVGGGAG
ncbi:MSMEG_4193 family putative phosphomutase [Phytoactinopolyspora alkaliphila]|uniref:MSMEG_4193 family putative phosphomutase n=1 Tax=Phytoactinopolyspora alkaliphila TaxID=1783498 RepID=A0A6N9YRL6_9ACTN|nr:MSMEG_4193 family putative phosphomutase [Phytoactinopolyspora alkaliphila]